MSRDQSLNDDIINVCPHFVYIIAFIPEVSVNSTNSSAKEQPIPLDL